MAANDGLGTAARVLHDCSLGDTAATGASARDPGARADLTITPGKVTGGQHGRAGPAGPIRSRGRARAREHTSRTVSRAMAIQRDCRPLILGHAPSTSDFAGAPSGSDVRRRTTAARRLGRCQPRTCLLHNGAMYASIWECAPATGRHQPTSLRLPHSHESLGVVTRRAWDRSQPLRRPRSQATSPHSQAGLSLQGC